MSDFSQTPKAAQVELHWEAGLPSRALNDPDKLEPGWWPQHATDYFFIVCPPSWDIGTGQRVIYSHLCDSCVIEIFHSCF